MACHPNRLAGKVAIVTGGAGALGSAFARRFVAEGARVLIGDIDERGADLAARLGEGVAFHPLDVASSASWREAVAAAESQLGAVNVLVNNAGIIAYHSLADATEAEYRRIVEVNEIGTFLGMQAVLEPMRRARGGSIVNISSTAGIYGPLFCVAYVASKWAIRGLTKAAALELAPDIRVNSVHPGTLRTVEYGDEDDVDVSRIPQGRFGEADEVASLVAYLASDESSYTTGAEHVIDGGETISLTNATHLPVGSGRDT